MYECAVTFNFRDYRAEWVKIRAESLAKKSAESNEPTSTSSNFVNEVSSGVELSDIYLRHPANESSSDSEGEEAPFTRKLSGSFLEPVCNSIIFLAADDEEEATSFRKVLEQQRELQIKRAKEAETRKQNTK